MERVDGRDRKKRGKVAVDIFWERKTTGKVSKNGGQKEGRAADLLAQRAKGQKGKDANCAATKRGELRRRFTVAQLCGSKREGMRKISRNPRGKWKGSVFKPPARGARWILREYVQRKKMATPGKNSLQKRRGDKTGRGNLGPFGRRGAAYY